ncbi:MAG: tetratricopeptide repeat-containing sensor histidine kinase [Mucilaginibacter sp.]
MPLLFFGACEQKKLPKTGYSQPFKQAIDSVNTLFGTNRLELGLRYIDSTLNALSEPTIDDRFRTLSYHYIYNLKVKGDNKKCLAIGENMLALAKQEAGTKFYASNYAEASFAIGDAFFNLEQYNDAYHHYYDGYLVAESNLDNNALGDYSYRMGMIMYKMKNYKLASDYFKTSFEMQGSTKDAFGDFYRRQELLDNIALSFKHNNQPDSAILYFNKALNYINTAGPQFKDRLKMIDIARGVVYGNEAEVLILRGDYKGGAELLKKSIAINLKKGYDNGDAELAEIKLAQLYYDQHQDEALFKLLTEINGQLDTIKNDIAAADWNRLMSDYYQRKNKLPEALRFLQTYNALNDVNIQKLNLLRESDINKQLDVYKKEQQISQLSVNNRYQKVYIAVITIFAIMASLIIFLVFRNWNRSKKDILKVNMLNAQINEQNIVLEKAFNELKNNNQEKDRILRAVAHDLRNPLGGIAALTALMEEDECSDEQRDQIKLIKQTSLNVLEMINEILEATNISSAAMNLEMVDVNSLISDSVELLRFKAAEKGQDIVLLPLTDNKELYVNREKIWRVISNLISNAIKFSPIGGSITVSAEVDKNDLVIAVKDNGIGIPEHIKDQVFNMFTTSQRPGTAGEKSFGLGLSICKQIMDKFDGKIWFEDNQNGGTTFFISLPLPAEKPGSAQKLPVPMAR